jgi:hypothetical protein
METRSVKISLETAQRWYNGTDKELKELALQTYPEVAKKELPKKWEELKKISGYYHPRPFVKIQRVYESENSLENHNVFATEKQAKSALAMAKLSQVMAVYNDGWVADWDNEDECKFCIVFVSDSIVINFVYLTKHFLALKTEELAKEFLTNFKEDIETYFNY